MVTIKSLLYNMIDSHAEIGIFDCLSRGDAFQRTGCRLVMLVLRKGFYTLNMK